MGGLISCEMNAFSRGCTVHLSVCSSLPEQPLQEHFRLLRPPPLPEPWRHSRVHRSRHRGIDSAQKLKNSPLTFQPASGPEQGWQTGGGEIGIRQKMREINWKEKINRERYCFDILSF